MESTRKAQQEKQMVMGLAALFVLTWLSGPLKKVMFRPHAAARAPSAKDMPAARSAGAVGSAAGKSSARGVGLMEGSDSLMVVPTVYTAQSLRDPLKSLLPDETAKTTTTTVATASNLAKPVPPPALQLQGVVWGGDKPKAIINYHVYNVGDDVEGATLTSIESGKVSLDFHGTVMSLSIIREAGGKSSVSRGPHR